MRTKFVWNLFGLVGMRLSLINSSSSDSALMLLITEYIHEDRDTMPLDCAKGCMPIRSQGEFQRPCRVVQAGKRAPRRVQSKSGPVLSESAHAYHSCRVERGSHTLDTDRQNGCPPQHGIWSCQRDASARLTATALLLDRTPLSKLH
jgi:hypothetical protein